MQKPADHPFILAYDAIINFASIEKTLQSCTVTDQSDSESKIPLEIHVPLPLLVKDEHRTPPSHSVVNYFTWLLRRSRDKREVDHEGRISLFDDKLNVRFYFDDNPEIYRDADVFGSELIPTQLLLDYAYYHAVAIAEHKTTVSISDAELLAACKSQVTIVTSFNSAELLALASGYETWDYQRDNFADVLARQGLACAHRYQSDSPMPTEPTE